MVTSPNSEGLPSKKADFDGNLQKNATLPSLGATLPLLYEVQTFIYAGCNLGLDDTRGGDFY